ncbi:MAG: GOLPH3/VPS74 family protein [Chloroflexota bacterium]
MLTLYEKLFLLSLDDQKGVVTPPASDSLTYGLAGALLAELVLQGRLRLKNGRLAVSDVTPTGNKKLDAILISVASSEKRRKPQHWMRALSKKKLTRRIVRGLVKKGVLKIEAKRCHQVMACGIPPRPDASAKYWVKESLRAAVLAHESTPTDVDTIILLSLLKACGLLGLVFTKDERKAARVEVERLTAGEPFGNAISRLRTGR